MRANDKVETLAQYLGLRLNHYRNSGGSGYYISTTSKGTVVAQFGDIASLNERLAAIVEFLGAEWQDVPPGPRLRLVRRKRVRPPE